MTRTIALPKKKPITVVFDRVYRMPITRMRFTKPSTSFRAYAVLAFGRVHKRLAIGNDTYKLLVEAGVPVGKR